MGDVELRRLWIETSPERTPTSYSYSGYLREPTLEEAADWLYQKLGEGNHPGIHLTIVKPGAAISE